MKAAQTIRPAPFLFHPAGSGDGGGAYTPNPPAVQLRPDHHPNRLQPGRENKHRNVIRSAPPKNKPARQPDLFAEQAPPERPDDAAPVAAATTIRDPLAGLVVKLEADFCRCGSNIATVGDGAAMHRASLICRSCGRHRGWLSKFTANWIEAVINLRGPPDDAITIRGPRL